MNTSIASNTIEMVASVILPLVNAGALHKTEQQAVIRILKEHTPDKQKTGKPVVTITEAAKMLCVSNRTVLRMIKAGELEAFRLRGHSPKSLRIRLNSIEALYSSKAG